MPRSSSFADSSATMQYEPHQRRTRELQVLALGLPRTGTASMRMALEKLGYVHCAHGFDIMDNPAYTRRWEELLDMKKRDLDRNGGSSTYSKPIDNRAVWDELLGHCAAVTDMPCAMFWPELTAAYPDAKVVLVQRDEDAWFRSVCAGVIEPMFSASGWFSRAFIEPLLGSRVGPTSLKALQCLFGADNEQAMKAAARPVYQRHYEQIRAALPSERLLNYRLGSGWGPLCEFLGKPIPDGDFPWINEVDALHEKIEQFKAQKLAELKASAGKLLIRTTIFASLVGLFLYFM